MKFNISKFIIILILGLTILGCQKDDPHLFEVTVPITDFIIQSSFTPFNTHYIPGNNGNIVIANIEQQIIDAGYELSEITEIVPGRAQLVAVFDEHTLNFIQAMSIRICNTGGANCGKEVFYRDPVPDNAGFAMGLVPSAIGNVKDILLNEQLFIQLKLENLWSSANANFQVRLEMDFKVR